ncbi:MAG: hypothetical protein ABID04_01785, partial [Patescibacteria group bacterium]
PTLFQSTPDQKILRPNIHGTIGIRQARSLIRWASLKPFQGQNKLALILQADKLTIEAQNCLLKIFEEPPKNTDLFLITQNKELLLPTVLSRCQNISWEKFLSSTSKPLRTNKHQGNPPPPPSNHAQAREFLAIITKSDLPQAFSWIAQTTKRLNRVESIHLLEQTTHLLHRETVEINNLQYLQLIDKIETTKKTLICQANIKLALENLYLKLQGKTVDQLTNVGNLNSYRSVNRLIS